MSLEPKNSIVQRCINVDSSSGKVVPCTGLLLHGVIYIDAPEGTLQNYFIYNTA